MHSRGRHPEQDNLIAIEMKKANRPQAEKTADKERLKALTKDTFDDTWSYDGVTLPEHVCRYVIGIYYPIEVNTQMLECFDGEYMIQQQASENIWLGRIADIGEELWMYSQNRECLIDEEDKPYLSGNLNEIKNRIDVMIKGLEQDASPDILSAVKKLCLAVYEGDSFNDEKYNELIACIQSTAN